MTWPTGVTNHSDDISAYDYELPSDLIAASPPAHRADSRLMVVDRIAGTIAHHQFRDLPQILDPGDRLVMNNSRVLMARLRGHRASTGGKWEGLFLKEQPAGQWHLLGQTRGRLLPSETILLSSPRNSAQPTLPLVLREKDAEGVWRAEPQSSQPALELLNLYGDVPLPPYIRKGVAEQADIERYQTVYAEIAGSIAAPTAGLHFTQEILDACRQRHIDASYLTLHVGIGTFRPVTVDKLSEHVMHFEYGELSSTLAKEVAQTRAAGGRIVAVGTTSVRVLEAASQQATLAPFSGETNLFIRPPYVFRSVDTLLTNFHLPRSTLLVLVSTFAGHELIRQAYQEAIAMRYRFFSYGDAMLIR